MHIPTYLPTFMHVSARTYGRAWHMVAGGPKNMDSPALEQTQSVSPCAIAVHALHACWWRPGLPEAITFPGARHHVSRFEPPTPTITGSRTWYANTPTHIQARTHMHTEKRAAQAGAFLIGIMPAEATVRHGAANRRHTGYRYTGGNGGTYFPSLRGTATLP